MLQTFDAKHYPASRLANPVCWACHWYGSTTITCDYYMETGQRKKGVGTSCNAYKPRAAAAKSYLPNFYVRKD